MNIIDYLYNSLLKENDFDVIIKEIMNDTFGVVLVDDKSPVDGDDAGHCTHPQPSDGNDSYAHLHALSPPLAQVVGVISPHQTHLALPTGDAKSIFLSETFNPDGNHSIFYYDDFTQADPAIITEPPALQNKFIMDLPEIDDETNALDILHMISLSNSNLESGERRTLGLGLTGMPAPSQVQVVVSSYVA